MLKQFTFVFREFVDSFALALNSTSGQTADYDDIRYTPACGKDIVPHRTIYLDKLVK